ncbi:MAG: hypothetical protein HQL06_13005 [Nitrospirae bacterium]|nr:hypothetical protein [Nitrospirota bacterium]
MLTRNEYRLSKKGKRISLYLPIPLIISILAIGEMSWVDFIPLVLLVYTLVYVSCFLDAYEYEGDWKDGNPNGQGTCIYTTNSVYTGEWKDGKQSGQGTRTYSDGRKYVGQFKYGSPNGFGALFYPDGKKFEGIWKDGSLITNDKPETSTNPKTRVFWIWWWSG